MDARMKKIYEPETQEYYASAEAKKVHEATESPEERLQEMGYIGYAGVEIRYAPNNKPRMGNNSPSKRSE